MYVVSGSYANIGPNSLAPSGAMGGRTSGAEPARRHGSRRTRRRRAVLQRRGQVSRPPDSCPSCCTSEICHRRASRDLPRDDQLPSVEEMKVVGACGRILPARAHPGAYASRLPSHWFGRLTRGKRTDASAQRGRYRAVGAFAQEHTKRAPIRLKRSLR
jgi:hypothetical protein